MTEIIFEAELGRRRVIHPGSPLAPRTRVHPAAAEEFKLLLAPGAVLLDAIIEALARRGADHGNLQLFDGALERAAYQTAPPDPRGELAVAYGPPRFLPGGAHLVMACATLGHGVDGKPLMHCHGVLRDHQGVLHGGHLPGQLCVIGRQGLSGWAVVPRDRGFVASPDAETGFSLLAPSHEA
jgi:hypothetical protein